MVRKPSDRSGRLRAGYGEKKYIAVNSSIKGRRALPKVEVFSEFDGLHQKPVS